MSQTSGFKGYTSRKAENHLEGLIACTSMKGSIARNLSRYGEAIATYDEAIRLTEWSQATDGDG